MAQQWEESCLQAQSSLNRALEAPAAHQISDTTHDTHLQYSPCPTYSTNNTAPDHNRLLVHCIAEGGAETHLSRRGMQLYEPTELPEDCVACLLCSKVLLLEEQAQFLIAELCAMLNTGLSEGSQRASPFQMSTSQQGRSSEHTSISALPVEKNSVQKPLGSNKASSFGLGA